MIRSTYKRAWLLVAHGDGVNDLFVAMETGSRLQGVQAFEEIHSERLPKVKTPWKNLERLSVRNGVMLK